MPETIAVPTVGETLTDIPLTDARGVASRLHREIEGTSAVVFFMRAADCPICVAHAKTLARMASTGELGSAAVLIVAPGGVDAAKIAEHRIGSDAVRVRASGDHHADLGLGRFLTVQHSGTFVTDDRGTLLSAVTSVLPISSFSKQKVLAALA